MRVTVSTMCPFCGGTTFLLRDGSDAADAMLIEQFRGQRVVCEHHDCEKSFAIRRGDVRIRRD